MSWSPRYLSFCDTSRSTWAISGGDIIGSAILAQLIPRSGLGHIGLFPIQGVDLPGEYVNLCFASSRSWILGSIK